MKRIFSGTLALSLLLMAGPSLAHDHGTSVSGKVGDPKRVTRTVQIEMSEYAFDKASLTFKAGETVRFVVSNKGKLKHELTIGTAEEQKAHRTAMQSMSDMNQGGHHHDGHNHDMPANAIHVAPGETRELVWEFTSAGALLFACNYPGHADLGMEGTIAVN